jgi:hypothetical protein
MPQLSWNHEMKNYWFTIFDCLFVCLMVFIATFNNISVISWPVSFIDGGLWEKTTDLSQVTDKLYHIMFYTSPWSRFELTTSVVIGTDCIGICKSNYHVITTNDSPFYTFDKRHGKNIIMEEFFIAIFTLNFLEGRYETSRSGSLFQKIWGSWKEIFRHG